MKKLCSFLRKHKMLIFCFITSFIVLFFTSKNSFLYSFNDWVDANAFMTIGKAWQNGIIPYRDLFEQKGPILYLIYMIGSVFSATTFYGVFLIEVMLFSVFLYYSYKLVTLFIPAKYSYGIIFAYATMISCSTFFVHGGSAEELCFSLFMISLYYMTKFVVEGFENVSKKIIFINGLIASFVALIKYTFLGFWFAWIFTIFIVFLIRKEYKKAFTFSIMFGLGFIIPIILFIIYFASVNGLDAFFETYIIANTKYYAVDISLLERLEQMKLLFKERFMEEGIIFYPTLIGLVFFLFSKKISTKFYYRFIIPFIYLLTAIGIYYGCRNMKYYFLPLTIFIIFGLIGIIYILMNWLKKLDKKIIIFMTITIIVACFFPLLTNNNIEFAKYKKEELVQYEFASYINKYKNPTLLNYNELDSGFYMASNVLPTVKYFMKYNIQYESFPISKDTQDFTVKDGKVDFVVTVMPLDKTEEYNPLFSKYEKVKEKYQIAEGKLKKYELYINKDLL